MIEVVSSYCYVGITLCFDLSWNSHIDLTCRKAKMKLGFIYRQFHCAPSQVVTNVYMQIVLPQLDYCTSVWDPYQKNQINALESVQSFAKKIYTQRLGSLKFY